MEKSWREIINRAGQEKRTYLLEHECKEILEKQGIPTTGAAAAQSAAEAVEISEKIGYPRCV